MSETTMVDLDIQERLARIRQLSVDADLKSRELAQSGWKLAIAFMTAGAAMMGVAVALAAALFRMHS